MLLETALQCRGKEGALENQVIGFRSRWQLVAEEATTEPGEPDEALARDGSGERA